MIITTEKVMRPRDAHDYYPTPLALCHAVIEEVYPLVRSWMPSILDPGAGDGVWGKAAREAFPHAWISGVEIREDAKKPICYNDWAHGDYLQRLMVPCSYNLICGNPPYKHAEAFVRKSYPLLKPGGIMVYLLRLAFLAGQDRGKGLWKEIPPRRVMICSRRPSFTGNRKTDATEYAVFVWQRASSPDCGTALNWLNWNYK